MNKSKTYRKSNINRGFEIISGVFLLIFALGSIFYNPADSFNQTCCLISGIIGIFLILYGFFYKVKISNDTLVFMILIPFKRISLSDVEHMKIETNDKDLNLLLKYKNGRVRKIPKIYRFKFYDELIQDMENVVKQKDIQNTNVEQTDNEKPNVAFMVVLYVFGILSAFILAGIVSYYFILAMKRFGITNNIVLIKLCVIIFFTISFYIVLKIFLAVVEKKKG